MSITNMLLRERDDLAVQMQTWNDQLDELQDREARHGQQLEDWKTSKMAENPQIAAIDKQIAELERQKQALPAYQEIINDIERARSEGAANRAAKKEALQVLVANGESSLATLNAFHERYSPKVEPTPAG